MMYTFVDLYADDAVLLAENSNSLQGMLDGLQNEIRSRYLKTNVLRTNIVDRENGANNGKLLANCEQLGHVDEFGGLFSKGNGWRNFKTCKFC